MPWPTEFTPNDPPAQTNGELAYWQKMNLLRNGSIGVGTEVKEARNGAATLKQRIDAVAAAAGGAGSEVVNARSATEVDGAPADNLTLRIEQIYAAIVASIAERVAKAGLDADLSAGGFRITGAADAADASDYTTLQQVNALIGGGGSPGDIPVTSLNVGTLDDGELLIRSGSGLQGISAAALQGFVTTTDANKTLEPYESCYVTADGLTITLPEEPEPGDRVTVGVGEFTDTVVARNGERIMELEEDIELDVELVSATFLYVNSAIGWRLV